MMEVKRRASCFILALFLQLTFAAFNVTAAPVQTYEFEDKQAEKTFYKLTEEIRCLVCQNQNIAESNSGLAKDLKLELFNMLSDGKSEDEIIAFMVKRYGDYVLYRPPFKPLTWALWFGPAIIFVIAIIVVIRHFKAQSKSDDNKLSDADLERIKVLRSKKGKSE